MQDDDLGKRTEDERELSMKELLEIVGPDLQFSRIVRLSHMQLTKTPDLDIIFDTVEELHLQGNFLRDVRALSSLQRLKFLALQGNNLETLEGISNLTELVVLDIRNNNIHNLKNGDIPPSVRYLNCRGNKFCEMVDFEEKLLEWLPKLVRLDGKSVRDTAKHSTTRSIPSDTNRSLPVRPSAISLLYSSPDNLQGSTEGMGNVDGDVITGPQISTSDTSSNRASSAPHPAGSAEEMTGDGDGIDSTSSFSSDSENKDHPMITTPTTKMASDMQKLSHDAALSSKDASPKQSTEPDFSSIRQKQREFAEQAKLDYNELDQLEKELIAMSVQSMAEARGYFRDIRQSQVERSQERLKEADRDTELLRTEFKKEVEVHKKVIQSKIGKIESKRIETVND